MNQISSMGISAAIITGLLIFAAANSVLAINTGIPGNRSMASNQMNPQMMMSQLLSGKNIKVGNMTLGFKPGVMVMPLMCMSFSGNFSGSPMFGNMMGRNMNQSSMMMGSGMQGNQSMNSMAAAMMMHKGMIPSVCFSMSDAMLFRSMMMHGGSMNGMMGPMNSMMGGGK